MKFSMIFEAQIADTSRKAEYQVMHESVGIVHGTMTTIHDATNTQTIIDRGHKDLRRARATGGIG